MPQPPDKLAKKAELAKKVKQHRRRGGAAFPRTETTPGHGKDRCDFCYRRTPPTEMTCYGCQDFTRRDVVRDGTVVTEVCTCHAPFLDPLPGEAVTIQSVVGNW